MMFFALTVALGLRVSFSLVLTQMVFIPNANLTVNPNDELICPIKYTLNATTTATNTVNETKKPKNEKKIMKRTHFQVNDRFQWSQQLQGIILSSFYWGYLISEIPGGILAQKYGAKVILLIGVFLSAIVAVLTPLAVAHGESPLVTSKLLIN